MTCYLSGGKFKTHFLWQLSFHWSTVAWVEYTFNVWVIFFYLFILQQLFFRFCCFFFILRLSIVILTVVKCMVCRRAGVVYQFVVCFIVKTTHHHQHHHRRENFRNLKKSFFLEIFRTPAWNFETLVALQYYLNEVIRTTLVRYVCLCFC